jgi:hypothetical protein
LAFGNKCVGILLAGEGFDMALAGLAGVVAKAKPGALRRPLFSKCVF